MKLLYPLLGLMLLLASAVQAASMTTIQLQSRPAEEIIPIVKPMLATGEVITGSGYKLFLRASPETQAMVMEIIGALDIAAKMLQISVFQGSEQELDTVSVSGNLQIQSGNSSVGIGSSEAGAGNINYNAGNASANANANGEVSSTSTQTQRTNSPVHQLRVSEGTEGFIQTGQQVAYYSGYNGTEFKDVTTGFFVLPRIHGGGVTLQVRPFKNTPGKKGSDSIETQSADTTITGRMGEWLPLGGVNEQFNRSQSSIGSYSSSQGSRKDSIWIRADLVK